MKTRIHVNQHAIKRNRARGKNELAEPVITCKTYRSNRYAFQASILDDKGDVVAKVIYSPEKPLPCGAHVWIETENEVRLV